MKPIYVWLASLIVYPILLYATNELVAIAWYSPEIRARVVSADGKPIAGAIVVVGWNIVAPWNGASLGQLALEEAATDKDGRFSIQSWGPRATFHGFINESEPTTRIFRAGYSPMVLSNTDAVPMMAAKRIIKYRFQNQTIVMPAWTGTQQQYATELKKFSENFEQLTFRTGRAEDSCYWKRIPRMLSALQREKAQLQNISPGQELRDAVDYAHTNHENCGDPKQFFEQYMNPAKSSPSE